MLPTVLFVPGIWVGSEPFEEVSKHVKAAGIQAEIATHPSTGTTSPGNPSMRDDITALRKHIQAVLDRDEDIVLVLHSAGGFLAGQAVQDLTKTSRGDKSGVVNAVLLTAAAFPVGHEHGSLPFAYVKDGALLCKNPENLLYNDLPESERAKWLTELRSQPAHGWGGIVSFIPWDHLPSTYVICEQDLLLPVAFQEQSAAVARSEIVRIQAGHMPMVTIPREVADIVIGVAKGERAQGQTRKDLDRQETPLETIALL